MLTFIVYILLLGIIKLMILGNPYYQKPYVLFAGYLLFLISALRSIQFGPDVIGYVNKYEELSNANLKDLFMDVVNNEGKDPLFYFISKLINMLGASPQIWLAIIAFIFCSAIVLLIYKYSDEPYMSIVMIISLGYLSFSFTGLRQAVAMAIILLSYKFLVERRIVYFTLFVFVASLFHLSAIFFLLAYLVKGFKTSWKQLTIIGISILMASFFKTPILKMVEILSLSDDRYLSYLDDPSTLNSTGFLIQLSIYIYCLFYKNNLTIKSEKNTLLYNLLFLGLVFQAFSLVIAESFRISMYFSIFSIILIPKVINAEPNKWLRTLIYILIWSMLVGYLLISTNLQNFTFFWQ